MRWLARAALDYSPDRWHEFAQPHSETDVTRAAVAHNTIRRDTMTTGTDQFAPFQKEASFYEPNSVLDIHIVLDEKRLSQEELLTIMRVLGQVGFGADASAGLGKFEVLSVDEDPTADTPCRRYVALSACTPQGTGLRAESSFFRSQTYFGRHGAERVYGPSPFKRPILMAAPGAVFDCGEAVSLSWIGKGISGHSVYADTVHQGYGVVLPIAHWFKETSHAK